MGVNKGRYAATPRPGVEPVTVMRWLQLRFDLDSTAVRLLISKVINVAVT